MTQNQLIDLIKKQMPSATNAEIRIHLNDALDEFCRKKNLLERNGVIVLHRNKISKENFSNKFKIIDERIYGMSKITFGQILI